MAYNYLPLAASVLGIGGGLATGGDKELDKLMKRYNEIADKGVGVGKLAAPGLGGVNSAFGEASRQTNAALAARGLSGTSLQNTNIADLSSRRASGMGDVYANAVAENERSKERARQALIGLTGMKSDRNNVAQQALGGLTGAGISGLLKGFTNSPEQIQLPDIGDGMNLSSFKPKPYTYTDYMKNQF